MDNQSANLPIDEQFLVAFGLADLPDEAKDKALDDVLYNLNVAVARRISNQLSEDQLDDFDKLMSGEFSKEQVDSWLQQNVPNYSQIVEEEANRLREEGMSTVERVMAKKRAEASGN